MKNIQKEISLPNLLKCKLRKNWVLATMPNDLPSPTGSLEPVAKAAVTQSRPWYWPMFTFTVTNEQPAVPGPQVPPVSSHCGHAPLACPTFSCHSSVAPQVLGAASGGVPPGAVLWATGVPGHSLPARGPSVFSLKSSLFSCSHR